MTLFAITLLDMENNYYMVTLGERVKHERKKQKLSMRTLASMSQTHHNTIYRIEHGQGNPELGVLIKICDALEIDPADLLSGLSNRRKDQ